MTTNEERRLHSEIMLRVARGMSIAGIQCDLGIDAPTILEVIWGHEGSDDMDRIDPTPDQIRLRCLAIRSGWSDEELAKREAMLR